MPNPFTARNWLKDNSDTDLFPDGCVREGEGRPPDFDRLTEDFHDLAIVAGLNLQPKTLRKELERRYASVCRRDKR